MCNPVRLATNHGWDLYHMYLKTALLQGEAMMKLLERARRGVDDALRLDLSDDASPTAAATSVDSLLTFKLSRFDVGSELDMIIESPQNTALHVINGTVQASQSTVALRAAKQGGCGGSEVQKKTRQTLLTEALTQLCGEGCRMLK